MVGMVVQAVVEVVCDAAQVKPITTGYKSYTKMAQRNYQGG